MPKTLKMLYNYHTHTYRCNHANGEEEDYIQRAVTNGIKHMGFSDHVPLQFPDGTESNFRIPVCDGKTYCDEIKALAEKYKEKIDINVGFEMEYYPEYFEKTLKEAKEYGAQYLILGQHYIGPENISPTPTIAKNENINELKEYVETIVLGMQTGVFSYVAHPDIFNFTGNNTLYQKEIQKICTAARELSVPLEINFLGIRQKRNYPHDSFWQIAGEERSPVLFGFDSHDVASAFDNQSLKKAQEIVRKYNLNYIEEPRLILLQDA